MRVELESSLLRWVDAQILDPAQADRIRELEQEAAPRRRSRWPVIVAVAFGGAMLAAGVLLFVSAHWDRLSPAERMTLLVAAVAVFHAAGAFTSDRFAALGTTLHAVGTVGLGGAIAMAGQVFHMQEHWPAAILLWALGAATGWLLLRDWTHLTTTAILAPWWLAGEWNERVGHGHAPVVACGALLLAISYFSVRRDSGESTAAATALTWLGGLALIPATITVALSRSWVAAPAEAWAIGVGWAAAIMIPLAVAYACRREAAWMNVVAALWVVALYGAAQARAEILVYGLCASGSAALVGWGIHELRTERINLGMAGFALTLVFFFFSSVMDKLGRSASLMALGVLCVAGGWYWEKLRRELIARVPRGGAE
jgi:hypothetical protein